MKTETEVCQYCKTCVQEHSMDWILRKDGDPFRPKEIDSEELVYGVYRQLVMHTEKVAGTISDAGLKVAQTVCARCWKKGKRFKKISSDPTGNR